MMNHSGKGLRAKLRRVALPLRVGELAGLADLLLSISLLEAVSEDFIKHNAAACWKYLACYACNFLSGQLGPLPAGQWSAAEKRAGQAIGRMTKRLLSHGQGETVDVTAIEKDLRLSRVDYTGEEVGVCHKLSLRQISPALPPKGHGGSIDLLGFVSTITQRFLNNPQLCILPDRGQTLPKLQGRVHVEKGEIEDISNALVQCGVCDWTPLSEVLTYRGERVLNGLFGVQKSSTISTGEPVLRVIMNLVPSNSVMLQLQGATKGLPSITTWMSTVLDENEQVRIWQSDMSNAFYLFRLPPQWKRYLAFNVVRNGTSLGLDPHQQYALSCCVLPMGWLSSVAVMQEISENLLLLHDLPREAQIAREHAVPLWMVGLLKEARENRRAWWHVYLDNYAGGQILSMEEDKTEGDRLHGLAEEAWRQANVMSSEKKRKRGVLEAEELGALIKGGTQTIGASPTRLLKVIHATPWVLSRPSLSKKHVQIIAGRWVHILQFRRAGMSFLEATWEYVGTRKFSKDLTCRVKRELWNCICAVPMLHTNLGASIPEFATASDASTTGGAIGVARALSQTGQDYVHAALRGQTFASTIPVIVLSLFNGIGGSFRCYDILGVTPMALISFEINAEANRVSSRRWPHSVQYGDVRDLDRELVRSWLLKYVGAKEIHIWSGFPCTDLTAVKAFREGLAGEQSRLFYEVPRINKVVKEECGEDITVKFVGENVASMGKAECTEITTTLGVWPYHLNPAQAVPMNRPRLCWCSEVLENVVDGLSFHEEEFWTTVTAPARYPEVEQWLEEGAI